MSSRFRPATARTPPPDHGCHNKEGNVAEHINITLRNAGVGARQGNPSLILYGRSPDRRPRSERGSPETKQRKCGSTRASEDVHRRLSLRRRHCAAQIPTQTRSTEPKPCTNFLKSDIRG